MNTHLTLKTLPKFLKSFDRLVNFHVEDKNKIPEREIPLQYAQTFGFDSFEDLEEFLFVESVSKKILSDEEMIKYANKSVSLSKISLEKDYVTIDEIENPSNEMVAFSIENNIENILNVKYLKTEYFNTAFTDSIVQKFYSRRNEVDEIPFYNEILIPLFEKCKKDNVYPTEAQLIDLLEISGVYFELIPMDLLTEKVRRKSISVAARNIVSLIKLEKEKGIPVTREEKFAAIENNPSIINHFEQDEEMVRLAFSLNKKSFEYFDKEFQTNERAKCCIDEITPFIISSMKKQNEEIIQYALDKCDDAAAFVTPHFRKKMNLDKKYNIGTSHANKYKEERSF